MKDIFKKWWFYAIVIVLLIIIISIMLYINNNPISRYSRQSILILKDYQNKDISRKEAQDLIGNIHDKSLEILKTTLNENTSNFSLLALKIELNLSGELSESQINDYIMQLQEYK